MCSVQKGSDNLGLDSVFDIDSLVGFDSIVGFDSVVGFDLDLVPSDVYNSYHYLPTTLYFFRLY